MIHKRLYHPIFQVIDQDGLTWGVAPRWTGRFTVAGLANDLVIGGRYFAGTNDALQYNNLRGSRNGADRQWRAAGGRITRASPRTGSGCCRRSRIVAGAKVLHDERDYENRLTGQRFSRSYDGLNPKLGLLWQPRPQVQVFTNITRSQDVPDFSDQLQTVNNRPFWAPLQAQRAWTVEAGTRGRFEGYGWDLTLFRSNLRGQLLQFTVDPSIPASTFNAGTYGEPGRRVRRACATWRAASPPPGTG